MAGGGAWANLVRRGAWGHLAGGRAWVHLAGGRAWVHLAGGRAWVHLTGGVLWVPLAGGGTLRWPHCRTPLRQLGGLPAIQELQRVGGDVFIVLWPFGTLSLIYKKL